MSLLRRILLYQPPPPPPTPPPESVNAREVLRYQIDASPDLWQLGPFWDNLEDRRGWWILILPLLGWSGWRSYRKERKKVLRKRRVAEQKARSDRA